MMDNGIEGRKLVRANYINNIVKSAELIADETYFYYKQERI